MFDILQTILDLLTSLSHLLYILLHLLLGWALLLAWAAWWLKGVNWSRAWPVLAQGAWVGVVLLAVLGALAWSQIAPGELNLGFTAVPNFWWQLGAVGFLVGGTLFLGWLQGILGWTPAEVALEPAENGHSHEHPHA
jgi:hypothetical protein